ncbi:MerR family transcriptional regulator [Curtobacterium sp. VKM Ac-1393]|uniref:MerR family transcriptional regulator n=1 Tax=Curtobacterium sp. VKM Ac-1393 TaxID=2783814 RepID=UPI00188AB423|nr:MerR family transcriptional regulator [Curtobacterium sp. VKM Ac-1393]MBF4606753.1 MerR family transcriptional regulator [Curtobacterium sp. VKM Ac-1393]
MKFSMTIGDFSRATRLSAKTLRFYHQSGILEPATIDPANGYRLYDAGQIVDAQVVRQLRSLEVPVETVREILDTTDVATRNDLIAGHLTRLEVKLEATQAAVLALRGLLTGPTMPLQVEHRSVAPTPALVARQLIDLANLGEWYTAAHQALSESIATSGASQSGPRGGIWATSLFLEEKGEAALFVPVHTIDGIGAFPETIRAEILPAVDLAITVHRGPDATMAQTYGALGAYVTGHELGVDGPIRETYLQEAVDVLPEAVTEIGWPIFRTIR